MPRYFIHIRTISEVDRDKVGIECASLDAAREYAALAVLEYVNSTDELDLELLATSSFEIVNDSRAWPSPRRLAGRTVRLAPASVTFAALPLM